MIIRSKTFEQWFLANFNKREIGELASHGAGTGWQGLTYTRDCVKLYDRFESEIWDALYDDASDFNGGNVPLFLASFTTAEQMTCGDTFKNMLVWYYAERLAMIHGGE